MTIEIQESELEAIIRQRMKSGRFESIEDILTAALRSTEPESASQLEPAKDLKEVWARASDLGVELDIIRHPVSDRPVGL